MKLATETFLHIIYLTKVKKNFYLG
ncbi:hypothetical protein YPPY14_1988, partial [Yersinia pestis PY-14]